MAKTRPTMARDEAFTLVSEHVSFLMAIQQLGLPPVALETLPGGGSENDANSIVSPVRAATLRRNQDRIDRYPHRPALHEALCAIVRACRSGDCTHADILGDLVDAPHLGIDLAELGCTYAEVREWHRSFTIGYIRTLLDACRRGQYGKLEELKQWLAVAGTKEAWPSPITLQDLGTSPEELERFERIRRLMP